MSQTADLERLRKTFAGAGALGPSSEDCPDPDRLWQLAQGTFDRDTVTALVDHVSGCPECAEALAIASRPGDDSPAHGTRFGASASPGESFGPARDPRRGRASLLQRFGGLRLAAAAAIVVAAIGIASFLGGPEGPAELRGRDAEASWRIEATLPADATLPREACRLSWTGGPEGTRYDVVVTDERLRSIGRFSGLEASELVIPEESLAVVPSGGRLLWRVEATLPDGSVRTSPTLATRVD